MQLGLQNRRNKGYRTYTMYTKTPHLPYLHVEQRFFGFSPLSFCRCFEEEAFIPAMQPSTGGVVSTWLRPVLAIILLGITIQQCQTILTTAYTIRLHAIENYGYSTFYHWILYGSGSCFAIIN